MESLAALSFWQIFFIAFKLIPAFLLAGISLVIILGASIVVGYMVGSLVIK